MTCGGIVLGFLVLVGGVWLADQVNSAWPIFVAIGIIIAFVVLRIVEFAGVRSHQKQANRCFDMIDAKIDAEDRGETEERRVTLSTGREVVLSRFRMPTGKFMWYVDPQGLGS